MAGCENCKNMERIKALLKSCETCDANAYRGHRVVRPNYIPSPCRISRDESRDEGVTTLSPEDEDKLRKAMASLFALDPVNLLLVRHMFNGGSLSSFASCLTGVKSDISKYRGNTRSMAHAKKVSISKSFPQIAPLLCQLSRENARPTAHVVKTRRVKHPVEVL